MSTRFETQYPITSREAEIKQILHFVTRGQSCQLISVPGAGRSTVLRLLAYHKKLREHHLASKGKGASFRGYFFVYVNFAEIGSFETGELTKALFLAILSAVREQGENKEPWTTLGKEIYAIFKEAISLNDPLVIFQALKRALTIKQFNNITIVFLFDRFSEFAEKVPSEFFSTLRSLRGASGGKLAVVFSTHRVLEDLLPAQHFGDFYELFVDNHVWLAMYDKAATEFRINVLEQENKHKLETALKKELVRLTGGHGKLMKLGVQTVLTSHPEFISGSREMPKQVRHDNVMDYLLNHILIKGSLLEIWQSLTREEKSILRTSANQDKQDLHSPSLVNFQLPFPLFTEFIKRNIIDQLVPKTVRFDERANEIFFGDEAIEGLTAQEFRLLKYLIANPNQVVERDNVINAVWSDTKTQAGVSDEALDQMVHRVRKKIEDEADNPKHLLTVKGRGFRFIP